MANPTRYHSLTERRCVVSELGPTLFELNRSSREIFDELIWSALFVIADAEIYHNRKGSEIQPSNREGSAIQPSSAVFSPYSSFCGGPFWLLEGVPAGKNFHLLKRTCTIDMPGQERKASKWKLTDGKTAKLNAIVRAGLIFKPGVFICHTNCSCC